MNARYFSGVLGDGCGAVRGHAGDAGDGAAEVLRRRAWRNWSSGGDLADLADVGASFGAGASYNVHPRIALRIDGDVEILTGADLASGGEAPDMTLFQYNGGVEVSVLEPGTSRWRVLVNGGAGATTIDSDEFGGAPAGDFNETYFTVNGGLKVGYDVTPHVNVFVDGQIYVAFGDDEDDTAALAALSPEFDAFDTFTSFPIYGGFRISFQ